MSQKMEITQDLEDVSTAVAELNKTQVGIAELRKKYSKVVFDVSTLEGITAARAARVEIRTPRYNIEHLRKEAKAPVLALGRDLDTLAAELTTEILALEEPIDAQIKAEEQRIEDDKQAKIDAEKQRVDDIQARITALSDGVDTIVNSKRTSANVTKCVAAYKKKPVDESFAEFQESAEDIWQTGLKRLESHLASVSDREAEDARIAAERVELAELRKADEMRRQEDAEAAAEAERQRHEKEAAERKQLEAERKQIDDEKKRIADEAAALEKEAAALAQNKRDDEAREKAKVDAENARQVAAQEAARRAVYPGDEAIVAALSAHFGVSAEVAENWINQLRGEQQ